MNEFKQPLYVQAAAVLRDAIRQGRFCSGEKISHRKLSEQYNYSKKVISDAIEILQAEGLIIVKPRVGSFINSSIWSPLIDKSTPSWGDLIKNSSSVASNEKIYSVYQLISSKPENLLGGTLISKDFYFHKPVKTAMERAVHRMDDLYTVNIAGIPSLRENIAKHMRRNGIQCESKDVLVTSGPMEALSVVVLSILRRGMRLYIEDSSILGAPSLARFTGADIRRIKTDDNGMSTEDLIKQIHNTKQSSALCISPVNQYPTGASLSKARRDMIMSACVNKNMPIIEYDMMRDFNRQAFPRPFKSFDENDLVIYIGSFISSYQNMKIGWIIAPAQIMRHITDTKTQFEINTNTVTQLIADEMLASGAYYDYVEEYTPRFLERIAFCRMLFEKYFAGTARWSGNTEGFYQWLEFDKPVNTYELLKQLKNTFVHSSYFFNPSDTSRIYINPMGDTMQNLENGLKEVADTIRRFS